jgi:hypothetical protein
VVDACRNTFLLIFSRYTCWGIKRRLFVRAILSEARTRGTIFLQMNAPSEGHRYDAYQVTKSKLNEDNNASLVDKMLHHCSRVQNATDTVITESTPPALERNVLDRCDC